MLVYLTSHIGGSRKKNGVRVPTRLSEENGFLESLRKNWKSGSNVLIISGDVDSPEINDSIKNIFAASFPMSGLPIAQMVVCDRRNEEIAGRISEYDVVILAGGHVPTQNAFFRKTGLKEHIKDFDGILIGISAGTMNSAEIVYAQPELEGESIDEKYQRFLSGLGITKLMILPHYQDIKDELLDGKRLFEEITYADSYGREFLALVDGSYLMIENGKTTLFGEAYLIRDGRIEQICEKDRFIDVRMRV